MSEIEALVRRAKDSLAAARGTLRDGFPDFAAARADYAMFYCAIAALPQDMGGVGVGAGSEPPPHRGALRLGDRGSLEASGGSQPQPLGRPDLEAGCP